MAARGARWRDAERLSNDPNETLTSGRLADRQLKANNLEVPEHAVRPMGGTIGLCRHTQRLIASPVVSMAHCRDQYSSPMNWP